MSALSGVCIVYMSVLSVWLVLSVFSALLGLPGWLKLWILSLFWKIQSKVWWLYCLFNEVICRFWEVFWFTLILNVQTEGRVFQRRCFFWEHPPPRRFLPDLGGSSGTSEAQIKPTMLFSKDLTKDSLDQSGNLQDPEALWFQRAYTWFGIRVGWVGNSGGWVGQVDQDQVR